MQDIQSLCFLNLRFFLMVLPWKGTLLVWSYLGCSVLCFEQMREADYLPHFGEMRKQKEV